MKYKFEMTGLDRLQKRISDLGDALQRIQGTLADDLSLRQAISACISVTIREINATADARVGPLASEPALAAIVVSLKEMRADFIRKKGEASRLASSPLEPLWLE